MLGSDSFFVGYMPYLMEKYFRKPELYHWILCAIANGNHKISDIGKFAGFAYNKCDNYVSALISAGIVETAKEKSKRGTEKTAYLLTNPYFGLWHRYIYQSRSELAIGNEEVLEAIIKAINEKEIHALHLQKAFRYVNYQMRWELWNEFRLWEKVVPVHKIVINGDFRYSFDAIHRHGEKAVFVKVFSEPLENCGRDEFDKIQKAVILTNKYYDSHVFVFAKRRFSEYAAKQAAGDATLSFVEVDRLRF